MSQLTLDIVEQVAHHAALKGDDETTNVIVRLLRNARLSSSYSCIEALVYQYVGADKLPHHPFFEAMDLASVIFMAFSDLTHLLHDHEQVSRYLPIVQRQWDVIFGHLMQDVMAFVEVGSICNNWHTFLDSGDENGGARSLFAGVSLMNICCSPTTSDDVFSEPTWDVSLLFAINPGLEQFLDSSEESDLEEDGIPLAELECASVENNDNVDSAEASDLEEDSIPLAELECASVENNDNVDSAEASDLEEDSIPLAGLECHIEEDSDGGDSTPPSESEEDGVPLAWLTCENLVETGSVLKHIRLKTPSVGAIEFNVKRATKYEIHLAAQLSQQEATGLFFDLFISRGHSTSPLSYLQSRVYDFVTKSGTRKYDYIQEGTVLMRLLTWADNVMTEPDEIHRMKHQVSSIVQHCMIVKPHKVKFPPHMIHKPLQSLKDAAISQLFQPLDGDDCQDMYRLSRIGGAVRFTHHFGPVVPFSVPAGHPRSSSLPIGSSVPFQLDIKGSKTGTLTMLLIATTVSSVKLHDVEMVHYDIQVADVESDWTEFLGFLLGWQQPCAW